ncbi:hypothetical protein RYX36_026397, partial [Vicia faba]
QENIVGDSVMLENKDSISGSVESYVIFDVNEFLDFFNDEPYEFDWVNKLLGFEQIQLPDNTDI